MYAIRLFQSLVVFIYTSACLASITNNESDAMQITTHFNNLTGISCDSTAQYCVAVGTSIQEARLNHIVYTTHDGGITWDHHTSLIHPDQEDTKIDIDPLSSEHLFSTIRCDSTGNQCLIAGITSIAGEPTLLTYTSRDGGQNWSKPTLIHVNEQDPGRTLVEGYPSLRLKCNTSGSSCILASNTISRLQHMPVFFITHNLGETWSEPSFLTVPSNVPYGLDVLDFGCDQSGLICTAVTSNQDSYDNKQTMQPPQMGLIYSTHDGGTTWSDAKPLMIARSKDQDPFIAIDDVLNLINCDQSGLNCVALGTHYTVKREENEVTILDNPSHAYLTKNGGLSWHDTYELLPEKGYTSAFAALDCDTSNRFCATVGIEFDENNDDQFHPVIHTTTDNGQTWHKKHFTPPENTLSFLLDVFCSEDAAFCHTVGFYLKGLNQSLIK